MDPETDTASVSLSSRSAAMNVEPTKVKIPVSLSSSSSLNNNCIQSTEVTPSPFLSSSSISSNVINSPVKVALRIRPVSEKDLLLNARASREVIVAQTADSIESSVTLSPSASTIGGEQSTALNNSSSIKHNLASSIDSERQHVLVDGRRRFTFDRVFSPDSTQMDVFHTSVMPLLDKFMDGNNVTIMAYGQVRRGFLLLSHSYFLSISIEAIWNTCPNIYFLQLDWFR